MFKRIFTTALVFGMVALAPPVHAAACAKHEDLTRQLTLKYDETLTARGLQNSETLMEIWSSQESGSYTVLLTHANGIACIVSTGSHWLVQTPVAKLDDTPS
ncbi:hypothetical protein ACFSUD_09515 [Sulfitobacter aestuarii]|uniref:Uncharacterized protein n=1 Tax=Sulfitobacter aestuarii TaxID=2161676 RepID=A0ABW5U2J4_9RHOB